MAQEQQGARRHWKRGGMDRGGSREEEKVEGVWYGGKFKNSDWCVTA